MMLPPSCCIVGLMHLITPVTAFSLMAKKFKFASFRALNIILFCLKFPTCPLANQQTEMSCEFFQQWLSICYSDTQLGLLNEISSSNLYVQSPILPCNPVATSELTSACCWPPTLGLFLHGHWVVDNGLL